MASTYSTSLRLELMATGDQSGAWGDTTNTNLGTLLEQAITGVLSVAQGDVANLTLTNLDGASDQARNMVVNLTGAMTAARNVVVPAPNKVYLIKNSTTGGFAITVKTPSGSGVTVPPGTARWVYADGTNVVDGMSGPWSPSANDAQALGFSGTAWADLFLASGGVINWNAGNVTLTQSANALAFAGVTSGVSMDGALSLSTTAAGTLQTLTSTDAGATAGPVSDFYRNSASPAANDILGQIIFNGKDSAANKQEYGSIEALIVSPTSTTETGALDIYTTIGGSRTKTMSVGPNNPNTTSQFIDGYATTATAAGTTTLTVLSAGQQYFTGTTTQTVVLPVTSTLVLGQTYTIVNNSTTGNVTVQSSGANTIAVLAPGTQAVFTCILTSGTTAASWSASLQGGPLAAQCRAWVNFNGTGTVATRGSFNVSSITDNGTGAYTVNFATALPDANYAGVVEVSVGGATTTTIAQIATDASLNIVAPTSTAFRVYSASRGGAVATDVEHYHVSIFR